MAKNIKTITSLQHPLVKHFVRLRKNRDYREEHKSVMIEGKKMIQEITPQHHVKVILTYDMTLLPPKIKTDEIYIVNEEIIEKISGVLSPEGVIAEIDLPQSASLQGMKFILALDGVNDPGNLGTLIRTALALGWQGAFLFNNCCDPFNEKALRASKGASFRLPIRTGSWTELMNIAQTNQLTLLAADMHGAPLEEFQGKQAVVLILGQEGSGLSEEVKAKATKIKVPLAGDMESLNVAAAGSILMYMLRA